MLSVSAETASRWRQRCAQGQARALRAPTSAVDFCSNDYLGLARSDLIARRLLEDATGPMLTGSSGSRLLAGHSDDVERLERTAAQYHGAPSALFFNSGYDANLGLFSTVARGPSSTVIYDDRIHASVRDGIVLARAKAYAFRHNDLDHLEGRLRRVKGGATFVAVEAVYSMDGDRAPLRELCELCEKYDAQLIVDEAHSVGVDGQRGEGASAAAGLADRISVRVVTYGKAFGCQGASVLAPADLRDLLINFAHSFVYTTALPRLNVLAVCHAYALMPDLGEARRHLASLIKYVGDEAHSMDNLTCEGTPIAAFYAGAPVLRDLADSLGRDGFDLRPIYSPTVRRGAERLRLILHAHNTHDDVRRMLKTVREATCAFS